MTIIITVRMYNVWLPLDQQLFHYRFTTDDNM